MNSLEKIMKGYQISKETFKRAQELSPEEYNPLSPEYLELWEEENPTIRELGVLGIVGEFLYALIHPCKVNNLRKEFKAYRAENLR